MIRFNVASFKGNLLIGIVGRIDIDDCKNFDAKIKEVRNTHPTGKIVLDFRELSYICATGIHVLLNLNSSATLKIVNIIPEVKAILEDAGVLDMFDVSDFIREIKVKPENLLEQYSNVKIYSVSKNTIVKLYSESTPLEFVINEHRNAHIAIKSGIPALIVYDVVKSDGCYGFLSELPEAKNIAAIVQASPISLSRCAMMAGNLLSFIHSIDEEKIPDEVPDIKVKLLFAAKNLTKYFHDNEIKIILEMINAIPDHKKFIHGSFLTRNIFIDNDVAYVSAFGYLMAGNPIFELGLVYMVNVLCAPVFSEEMNNLTADQSRQFWQVFLQSYMGIKAKTRQAQILIHAAGLLMMSLYPAIHELRPEVTDKIVALARRDLFPAGETLIQFLKEAHLETFTKTSSTAL